MELPQTLPAQLYLLAWDPNRRRFCFDTDNSWNADWRFDRALRAAMLTDLYLTGYVKDDNGTACRVRAERHDDPVLDEALLDASGHEWLQLVTVGGTHARRVVHDQLEAAGWISGKQRRILGLISTGEIRLYDEQMVGALAGRVTEALRNILADRSAEPRPLALGLIAVNAQMSVVSDFVENRQQREALREMTLAAIEPILAFHESIQVRLADRRSGTGGGCGGGGCGGGS